MPCRAWVSFAILLHLVTEESLKIELAVISFCIRISVCVISFV